MDPTMDDITRRQERFRELYRDWSRPLLGYALRRVAAPADAADVVAETFLVTWRRLDDVPPGREARLWLYGVARRVLANHRRGALRRSALGDKLRAELTRHVPVDDGTEGSATVAAVRDAIARLPEIDREVLHLAAWEGLSPTEIAAVLVVPVSTVRTRLHRARQRLRRALDEDDGILERSTSPGHVHSGGHLPAPDGREEP